MQLADIFSQSMAFLSILLEEPFMEQKFLISMMLKLSIFPFMDYDFGVKSEET